jgi:hypothetical protein
MEVAALTGYLCVTFKAIILTYRLGSEKSRDKHLNISETVMRFGPIRPTPEIELPLLNEQYIDRNPLRFY